MALTKFIVLLKYNLKTVKNNLKYAPRTKCKAWYLVLKMFYIHFFEKVGQSDAECTKLYYVPL